MFTDIIRNKIENSEIVDWQGAVGFGEEWAKNNNITAEDLNNGIKDNLSEFVATIYTDDHEALGKVLCDLFADCVINDFGGRADTVILNKEGRINISFSHNVAIVYTSEVAYKMEFGEE